VLIEEVIDEFRNQVSDRSTPYLFSDDEILRWVIDAQDQLVRAYGGIADGRTTELIDLPVTTGDPWTAFSPYILRIRSGRMLETLKDVDFIHEADLTSFRVRDYGYQIPNVLDDEDTGVVNAGILGITDKMIRWYKVPATDDTCRLHIYRLPYPRIKTIDDCLEIDDKHHLELITWMKYKAYGKEDAETYDESLMEQNKGRWDDYVEQVKAEVSRERHKPKQIRYGGIPW
jgi:hypothetical protein